METTQQERLTASEFIAHARVEVLISLVLALVCLVATIEAAALGMTDFDVVVVNVGCLAFVVALLRSGLSIAREEVRFTRLMGAVKKEITKQ